MLDHICYPVKDYETSLKWYLAALAPLGYAKKVEFERGGVKIAGLGDSKSTDLWIWQGTADEHEHQFGKRYHVGFGTMSHRTVREFYNAAIEAGGTDNGKPGPRAHYGPDYYGAFVYDPDGNNVEAVCKAPAGTLEEERE